MTRRLSHRPVVYDSISPISQYKSGNVDREVNPRQGSRTSFTHSQLHNAESYSRNRDFKSRRHDSCTIYGLRLKGQPFVFLFIPPKHVAMIRIPPSAMPFVALTLLGVASCQQFPSGWQPDMANWGDFPKVPYQVWSSVQPLTEQDRQIVSSVCSNFSKFRYIIPYQLTRS